MFTKFITRHYNMIQFIGYVPSSLVLGLRNGLHGFEGSAALLFLLGSALIALFDPIKRPSLLFYGGISIAAGGLCLMAAGYPITGFAIALSSFETARGGLKKLGTHRFEQRVLWPYTYMMETFCIRFKRAGDFINERPFITGGLIRAPLRLEFVIRNAMRGDFVNVTIGVSWMIGDAALAVNDEKFRNWIERPYFSFPFKRNT